MKQWEPAYEDWKAGMKYKDIADKYGVSENAVKSWAARYFKPKQAEEGKKKVATKGKKKLQPAAQKSQPKKERSAGAPLGNTNAVGNNGGAPPGNQNRYIHGLYSKVYLDALDDVEKALLEELPDDEEAMLLQQIDLFTIRERRLLLSIKKYRDADSATKSTSGLSVTQVMRSEWKKEIPKTPEAANVEEWSDEDEKDSKGMPRKHSYQMNTVTVANVEILQRLEGELTRVQAKKTKAIETLNLIRKTKREAQQGGGDELVDDWISAVTGGGEDNRA